MTSQHNPLPHQDVLETRPSSAQPAATAAIRARVLGDLFHGEVPPGARYVGRPAPGLAGSPFANRHRAGECRCGNHHQDQTAAVQAFADDLTADPRLVEKARTELAGLNLACWCRKGPCHADVLILVAAGWTPLDAADEVLRAA